MRYNMNIRITPDTCELLSNWHGEKDTPSYKLLHSGQGDPRTIKSTIAELSDIKIQYRLKLTQDDFDEINSLISSLEKLVK